VDVFIRTTRSAVDPLNLKKKFFLEQSGGSLKHGLWSDKKIKNSEQFFKNAHRRHGEDLVGNV
jgi:hypothetical protein